MHLAFVRYFLVAQCLIQALKAQNIAREGSNDLVGPVLIQNALSAGVKIVNASQAWTSKPYVLHWIGDSKPPWSLELWQTDDASYSTAKTFVRYLACEYLYAADMHSCD